MVSHIERLQGINVEQKKGSYNTSGIVNPRTEVARPNYLDVPKGKNPFYQIISCNSADTTTYIGTTPFENVIPFISKNGERDYRVLDSGLVEVEEVLERGEFAIIDIQDSPDTSPVPHKITHE